MINLRTCITTTTVVCLLASLSFAEDKPTAEDIIEKHIEASGGEKALAKVKNRKATGMLLLKGMGVEADLLSFTAPPNTWTEIFLGPFGAVERGMSDGVAWEIHPSEGPRILTDDDAADMQRQTSLSVLSEWEKYFETAEYVGEEEIGGETYHKLKMTPKDGSPVEQFFSKESGLLHMTRGTQNSGPTSSKLSDYKEVDDIQIPHKIEATGGPYEIEINLETIEHNVEIPADRFVLPAQIKALQSAETATP